MTLPLPVPLPEAEEPVATGLDALRVELDKENPAFVPEVSPHPLTSDVPAEDDPVEALTDGQTDELAKQAMTALYGNTFPLAGNNPTEDDWVRWSDALWDRHSAAMQERLHIVKRNRLFRKGIQWISSLGLGPWREPPKPRDSARVVHNMIGPALDYRVQLIAENRPGFRMRPEGNDPNKMKRAEAQQFALEYQYSQQNMSKILREMEYWAGTDGIAFCEETWDPERGPWEEYLLGERPQPVGDIKPRVLRIEQVRCSANATMSEEPWYLIIKEVIAKATAVKLYGPEVAEVESERTDPTVTGRLSPAIRLGFQTVDPQELQRDQDVVERTTVYCKPSQYLPKGLMLIVVGKKVIFMDQLPIGCIPVWWVRDGSSDPAFFPKAIMEDWIDSQMRVNAILSKWVENVRLNAGPKLLAKQHALVGETLVGGTMSVIEVKGLGEVNSNVRPIEAFSLAQDAKELLALEQKTFEDLSGWNDTTRGQSGADQSGRAILANRETMERIFAPVINAATEGMQHWAKITLAWMAWGYDMPRTIALNAGRPDLARVVTAQDFNGVTDVWIDPETLMPMPRALKIFLLDQMYDRRLIDAREYRQRYQFGFVRNLQYPDDDQEARARRVCEAIRQTANPMALPILWMDDEAVHQDILQRELLLPDDVPQPIRGAAFERWMMLAQQSQMKMGGMPMGGPGAAPPQGGQPPQQPGNGQPPQQMNAQGAPFQSTNPSIGAANAAAMSGPDENRLGRAFDQQPH